jgi:signal transduction histidine kinase
VAEAEALVLPCLDGTDLLGTVARLSDAHPGKPLLVLGHDPGAVTVAAAMRAGARGWIPTPLAPDWAGVLGILRREDGAAGEKVRELNRTVATVTAELESAHQELQGRVAQLVMLYRIGRDLSNHSNWDEALSRFLRSLRTFLGASGAGLLLTSEEGRVVQARRVDGLAPSLVDRACRLLRSGTPPTIRDPYLVPLEEMGRDRPTPCVDRESAWRETVLPLRHHDRDLGWLLLEKDYADGRAIGQDIYFLITVQTILTEEVAGAQAVSELRRLKRFHERTLDQVQTGILTYDETGVLLYANRKGRELLDRPGGEQPGEPKLRMGGDVMDLAAWAMQAGAGAPLVAEGWLAVGSGGAVPVSLKASRMPGDLPGTTHCIVVLEDQRATHELEAERRRAARQGEHLIMAAEWAHDVRTPLTGILHSAELLCDALPESSPKRRHFQVVREEVDRINGLVSNFLDFARPAHLKTAPTRLADLCLRVEDLLRGEAARRDLHLDLDLLDEAADVLAVVDPDQLQQVLLNLATNALDASPPGGRVLLRLTLETAPSELWQDGPVDRVVVLEVQDEGPGVPAEHRERLFIPFFTTKPDGTGLGLAIAEKIIRAHHGHLRYERRGSNTVLRAVLPLLTQAGGVSGRLEARG